MFVNLIEAGQSEVNNGSSNNVHSGGGSTISDIQFGDPSGPRLGRCILRNVKYISLTLTS